MITQVSPKKVFESDSNPKKSSQRDQNVQNGLKFGRIKNKKIEFHFKNKVEKFKPDPDPKNSPKAPKIAQKGPAKEAPNVAELKQKDRAVFPKAKLRVYIGRSQKSF